MIITKRSDVETNQYSQNGSAVGLLERKPDSAYENTTFETDSVATEDYEREKLLRRRNLEKILNYDNESAMLKIAEQEKQEAEGVVDRVAPATVETDDEDIRPTSTTMQFGEATEDIRFEMNRTETVTSKKEKMSVKSKILMTIYSLCVAVIFALIVLNTGIIATLTEKTAVKQQELQVLTERYEEIVTEIDAISNDTYVIDTAENVYGMIKK